MVFRFRTLLQMVPNPSERDFDIFGNPSPQRARPASAATSAARYVASFSPPPAPESAAAGIPSSHNNARSPGARFATACARAENENRRVFGHQTDLPVPSRFPATGVVRTAVGSPVVPPPQLPHGNGAGDPANSLSSPSSSSKLVFRPRNLVIPPLSAAAAKHGPFKGRVVSGIHFRQAFVSSYAARPGDLAAVDPSLLRGRWPQPPSAPGRVGAFSRQLGISPRAATKPAPHPTARTPSRPATSIAAAGARPSARRSTRAMATPGGESSMGNILNWGH